MTKTTQIFHLDCSHTYFSGAIGGIELQPTQATERWMKTHRILMRALPADITLYRTAETPEDYGSLLTFWMRITDIEFYNYTILPFFSQNDSLCYLSDVNGRLQANTEIEEQDILEKIYGLSISASKGEEKSLRIVNQTGEIVLEMPWNGLTSLSGLWKDWEPGKYNWTFGDEQGFFFGDPEKTNTVFGLIEIDLKTTENPSYTITFQVRSSVWEYYIIEKQPNGNNYEVLDEKQQYVFKTGEPATVLGGRAALKIASQGLIPFKQRPDYEFKLITKPHPETMAQPWNMFLKLPAAQSENVRPSGEEPTLYTTPIYIYI